MPRHGLTEPTPRFATAGSIAANRIVKLASDGTLSLAGAADENAIGATTVGAATGLNTGPPVHLKTAPGVALVEVAAAVTITRGNVAYQAASGKVADTGTVRAGVAITGGTAGELIEVLFD